MVSTWYARIRIEKAGDYAEHDGTIRIEHPGGAHAPTPRDVEQAVIALITHQSPHLKGGRITHRTIRKLP
jgi:hypothetical protein